MDPELYGLLVRVHGHVAVLGLAVLLHPVIQLRTRRGLSRWTRFTADLGALLTAAPFALGWALYPAYRSHVKPSLWMGRLPVALAFESKEHLALLSVAFAVSGALTLRLAGRTPEGRQTAWALLLAGWGCGALAAALGIWVSAVAQPGW